MATSITLSQKSQAGKDITRSITNIAPDASKGQISAFALALNHLTTNHLNQVNRIDKTEVDILETYYDITWAVEYIVSESSTSADNYIINGNTLTVKYNNIPASIDDCDNILIKPSIQGNVFVPEKLIITPIYEFKFYNQIKMYSYKINGSTLPANMLMTIPEGRIIIGSNVYFYNASMLKIVSEGN